MSYHILKACNIVNAQLREPVKNLDEEQAGKQAQDFQVELFTENSQRQTSFGDGITRVIEHVSQFVSRQGTEKDIANEIADQNNQPERKVAKNLQEKARKFK